MLTNDDLKILSKVIDFLSGIATYNATECCNELIEIYNKVVDNKNKLSEKSREYNKKNIKYHRLINAMSYHKGRGNWARVRELEKDLENLRKNSTIEK